MFFGSVDSSGVKPHLLRSADSKGFTGDTLGNIDPNKLRRILAFSGRGRRRYMNDDNRLVYSCQEKSKEGPLPNRCREDCRQNPIVLFTVQKIGRPSASAEPALVKLNVAR